MRLSPDRWPFPRRMPDPNTTGARDCITCYSPHCSRDGRLVRLDRPPPRPPSTPPKVSTRKKKNNNKPHTSQPILTPWRSSTPEELSRLRIPQKFLKAIVPLWRSPEVAVLRHRARPPLDWRLRRHDRYWNAGSRGSHASLLLLKKNSIIINKIRF